jgi:hypothetical protein
MMMSLVIVILVDDEAMVVAFDRTYFDQLLVEELNVAISGLCEIT